MNNEAMKENLKTLFDGVESAFNTRTCIGKEIVVGDTTIIPFVELTMGAGTIEFEGKSFELDESGGFGVKATPVACLVIQNGFTKVVHISSNDPISKLIDMIPDIIDKMTGEEDEDVKNVIDHMKDNSYN